MMRLDNLSKSYGPRILFQDITYHFPEGGKIALVGANGAGKTTLLKILCGIEDADRGQITKPGKMILGYLPQEPNPHPKASILEEALHGHDRLQELHQRMETLMARMATQWSPEVQDSFERAETLWRNEGGPLLEARTRSILLGLGFQESQMEKSPLELSGGWRMRLELARIFVREPDFLILDEPTNHLDLPSLAWVEKWLQEFPGTLLFVSHDRALLNRLSSYTLHLHNGKFNSYKGNFDQFLEERELRMAQNAAEAEKLRKRREQLERFAERFGAKASKAKQASSKLNAAARIREMENDLEVEDPENELNIFLAEPPKCGREVLSIEGLSIGYDKPLSQGLNLKIQRGQKVAIIGANGIGKSTLLKTLVGEIPALGGTWAWGTGVQPAWFAQDQAQVLDLNANVLANVMSATADLTEKRARQLLGSFLFRGDDVFKPVRVLSGGEKNRVGLAQLLVKEANILLLDEPTNHLDMTSAEILADTLGEYEGTLLFVSHDRNFIDAVCTHVFAMLPDGRGSLFEGKLDDYARLAALSGFPDVLNPAPVINSRNGSSPSPVTASQEERLNSQESRRERQRLQKAVARAEEEMEALSREKDDLLAQLESGAGDFKRLQELSKKVQLIQEKLQSAEGVWLEASEKLSSL